MQSEVKLVSQRGEEEVMRGTACARNLQDSPFENSSFSFGIYSKTDRLLHRAIGDCFCDAVTDRLFLRVRAIPYLPSRGSRGGFIGKPLIRV